jgi:hypothetical protein
MESWQFPLGFPELMLSSSTNNDIIACVQERFSQSKTDSRRATRNENRVSANLH